MAAVFDRSLLVILRDLRKEKKKIEMKRCMRRDRWIALVDADQQRQNSGLDRDRIVCECPTSDSIVLSVVGRKEALFI